MTTALKAKKIVVLGGNGYVGQAIVRAFNPDCQVFSVSRSGCPPNLTASNSNSNSNSNVHWLKGDIFNPDTYKSILQDADCVVSCVGAFGSNEFMNRINGDANVLAVQEAQKAKAKRFLYISTVENNLPDFVLQGYFHGKRRTESAVKDVFGENGFVLRPGFMYGTRYVPVGGGHLLPIPLWLLGKPLDWLFSTPLRNLQALPGLRAICSQPLDVDSVGKVAAHIACNGAQTSNFASPLQQSNVLSEDDIRNFVF